MARNAARKSTATETETTNQETQVDENKTIGTPANDVNPILRDFDLDKLKGEYKTKSALIRYLSSQEYPRAAIAKALDIRYQHVRNVLVQPLKTNATAESQPNPEAARKTEAK